MGTTRPIAQTGAPVAGALQSFRQPRLRSRTHGRSARWPHRGCAGVLPGGSSGQRLLLLGDTPTSSSSLSRAAVQVVAASASTYRERGRNFHPENVEVKRILGEGCYGQVFEGVLSDAGKDVGVVLKKVKLKVEGAQEMMEMEHMLNLHVAEAAKGACAEFLGYMNVTPENASGRVTQGLWLVWEFRGSRTLAFYLRHRTGMELMAEDLGVAPESAVPTAMKQLLGCLKSLHAARVVHRDVKPLNMVLDQQERRFRLIDLGAAVDLATGINYVPDESILDAHYCAPEHYVLPTDSVDLAEQALPVAMVMSPMLWAKHSPDRFDIYSAGLILMQLAVPQLRSERGLLAFNAAIKKADFDLFEWREASRHTFAKSNAVLDADDGAGWKLAAAMLRKRILEGEIDGHGNVQKQSKGLPRPSAASSLNYAFLKQADQPRQEASSSYSSDSMLEDGTPAAEGGEAGAWSNAFGAWKKISGRLFALEASIVSQTSVTQKQKGTVKQLQEEVAAAAASAEELEAERLKLEEMEERLKRDVGQFEKLTVGASKWISGFLSSDETPESSSIDASTDGEEEKVAEAPSPAAAAGAGLDEAVEDVSKRAKGSADIIDVGSAFGSLAGRVAGQMAAALRSDAERRAERAAARAAKEQEKQQRKEQEQAEAAAEAAAAAAAAAAEEKEEEKEQGLVTPEVMQPEAVKAEAAVERSLTPSMEEVEAEEEELVVAPQQQWASKDNVLLAAQLQRLADQEERELRMKHEVEFRQMLDELVDPPVTPLTPWAVVKRRVWSDYRFVAVEPDCRETVFAEYIEILQDYEKALESQRAEKGAAEEEAEVAKVEDREPPRSNAPSSPGVPDVKGPAKELDTLVNSAVEDLQSLQQSMHDEYAVLEEKLAQMEKSLLRKETKLKEVRNNHRQASNEARGAEGKQKGDDEDEESEFSPGFQGDLVASKGGRRDSNPEGWLKRGSEPESGSSPAINGKTRAPR